MSISCVIPTIWKDYMINNLVLQLVEQDEFDQLLILDNSNIDHAYTLADFKNKKITLLPTAGLNIYQQWNYGVSIAKNSFSDCSIAILNDDLIIHSENFLTKLVNPLLLDVDIWASCGNYDERLSTGEYIEVAGTYKDNGFAGFCFAISSQVNFGGNEIFDSNYNWWYGDDDLIHSIHKFGKKTVMATNASFTHIDGGSKSTGGYTPEFNSMVEQDRIYYMEKWHA
jgi:hypothetical protein